MSSYTYTLGLDLPSQVDIGALHEDLSNTFPSNESYITLSGTSLMVYFESPLTILQQVTLSNLITQYQYTAPVVREYFEYPIQILDTTNSVSSGSTGALLVDGGVFINKDLYAANLFMGTERVATETFVANQGITFGTGLTKTGNVVSVNVSLTHVTQVGTLSSLTLSGALSGTTGSFTGTVTGASPTLSGHLTTKAYVDSLVYLTAGTGLTLTNGTLSINSSQTQITSVGTLTALSVTGTATFSGTVTAPTPVNTTDVTNKSYVDSLGYLTAGTGLTKTGATLSVNASQPQITSVGTLTSLTVSGALSGATATFTGTVTGATPTASGHLTTKTYVDSLGYLTAGTGLTKTGSTLSVNASQTQITSVGTLTGLTLSGALSGTNASFTGTVTGATPTASGHLTTKTYVDSLGYLTAGTGLTKTGSTLSVNASQTQITAVGTLTSLVLSGALSGTSATFTGSISIPTAPTLGTHAVNKDYVDAVVSGITSKVAVVAASTTSILLSTAIAGTTLDGVTLASGNRILLKNQTNAIENGIYVVQTLLSPVRASDFAVGMDISGTFVFVEGGAVNASSGWITTNTSGNDIVGTHPVTWVQFSGAGQINAGNGLSKTGNTLDVNIDNTSLEIIADTIRISSGALGTGLSGGSGTTISVNASQPQITSLGTLVSLSISGALSGTTATFTGTVTGATPTLSGHLTTKTYVDSLGYLTAGTGLTLTNGTLSINSNQPQITTVGTLSSLAVSGNSTFSGSVTVPTPANTTDATNKSYVDSIGYLTAGTGLTKTGSTLSVNASQTQITTVGTLTSLTVSGALSGSTATFSGAVTVSTPVGTTDATNKAYVDSLGYLTAGTGLTKTGATLSVNASQPQITSVGTLTSLTISGALSGATASFTGTVTGATPTASGHLTTKTYVDSLGYLTAGTGLTKTGSTLSVNASQTQITTVGTLTSLTVSGALSGSTATFSGSVTVPTPVNTTDVTNKTYVDSLGYLTAGTGLTKSGSTLSVNASQTQITSVGTLTSLTLSGALSGTTASFTGNISIPIAPTQGTHAVNKSYVDGLISGISAKTAVVVASTATMALSSVTSGSVMDGVTLTTGDRILLKNQTVGTENGIYVIQASGAPVRASDFSVGMDISGTFVFVESGSVNASSGWVTTNTFGNDIVGTHPVVWVQFSGTGQINAGNGLSKTGNILDVNVDNTSLEIIADTIRISSGALGTGLSGGSGTLISVNASQPQITSVGTLTSLSISGSLSGTTATFTGTVSGATPTTSGHLTTKSYVDSIGYLTAGTGLTKTGSTLSVNASQTQITSVGTLTSLTLSGALSGTTATFSGVVSGASPTLSGHLTTKAYVDSLAFLTASTGLTLTSGVLSVNATQTQITTVGTLIGLTVSGVTNLTSGTASNSTNTGALVVNGGIGVSGAIYGTTAVFSSNISSVAPILDSHLTTKAYVDNLLSGTTVVAGTGLTLTGSTLSVNASQTQVTTVGTLTGLTVSGNTSITSGTASTSTSTGALVVSGGAGVSGSINIGGAVKLTQVSPQVISPSSKGTLFEINDVAVTNSSTSTSGTLVNYFNAYIGAPTLSATNTNVTTTNATSLYIAGAPISGTNNTITNSYPLWVAGSTSVSRFDGYINSVSIDVANSSYLVYERQNLPTLNRTLLQGSILGNASYTQANGYIQLTPATTNQNGYVEWRMTPGASWSCTFEYYYTGTGDFIHFYAYQSRSLLGTTGNNFGGIGIVFDNWNNRIWYMSPSATVYSTPTASYLSGSYRTTYPSGTWHSASISFEMGILTVYVNQTLIFSQTIDSNTLVKSQNTIFGFAAYCGGVGTGNHWIRNMYMAKDPYGMTPSHTTPGSYDISPRIALRITNTTDSTSPTTGALTVAGGLGVSRTAEFGAGVVYKTRLVSSNTTITMMDHMIAVDTTSGNITVTLPSATAGTEGFEFKISKVTNDTNALIVAPQTGESIGGATTGNWSLTSAYASIHIISIGGGKWGIIAVHDPISTNIGSSSDPIWSNASRGAIDGTVTISSNTSLTRDMYYLNLTVNSNVTLTSNGWRIFVYGTLTLNGRISNDGGSASGTTAGIAPLTNHLGGGTNGGSGRTGSGNASNGVSSPTANFLGGRGGQTFATLSGRNGGNAGVITYLQESDGGQNVMASFPYGLTGRCTGNGSTGLCGGTGGAGGALERGITSSGRSGGGGAGAGTVIVAARTLVGTGSITANGGNGADAAYTGNLGSTTAIGGGGGGGGGVVSVFYRFNTSSVTFSANGGTGGMSFGNVSDGQNGENGLVYVNQV